ncbi:hypothetical protein ABPG72_006203 [Tetrahymena utriculariae]
MSQRQQTIDSGKQFQFIQRSLRQQDQLEKMSLQPGLNYQKQYYNEGYQVQQDNIQEDDEDDEGPPLIEDEYDASPTLKYFQSNNQQVNAPFDLKNGNKVNDNGLTDQNRININQKSRDNLSINDSNNNNITKILNTPQQKAININGNANTNININANNNYNKQQKQQEEQEKKEANEQMNGNQKKIIQQSEAEIKKGNNLTDQLKKEDIDDKEAIGGYIQQLNKMIEATDKQIKEEVKLKSILKKLEEQIQQDKTTYEQMYKLDNFKIMDENYKTQIELQIEEDMKNIQQKALIEIMMLINTNGQEPLNEKDKKERDNEKEKVILQNLNACMRLLRNRQQEISQQEIFKNIKEYMEKIIQSKMETVQHVKYNLRMLDDCKKYRQISSKMANTIKQFHKIIIDDLNKLKNFNQELPTQQELEYKNKNEYLEKQIQNEQKRRRELEEELKKRIDDFKTLFYDAQKAKEIIKEQLKGIQKEKEELKRLQEELKQEKEAKKQAQPEQPINAGKGNNPENIIKRSDRNSSASIYYQNKQYGRNQNKEEDLHMSQNSSDQKDQRRALNYEHRQNYDEDINDDNYLETYESFDQKSDFKSQNQNNFIKPQKLEIQGSSPNSQLINGQQQQYTKQQNQQQGQQQPSQVQQQQFQYQQQQIQYQQQPQTQQQQYQFQSQQSQQQQQLPQLQLQNQLTFQQINSPTNAFSLQNESKIPNQNNLPLKIGQYSPITSPINDPSNIQNQFSSHIKKEINKTVGKSSLKKKSSDHVNEEEQKNQQQLSIGFFDFNFVPNPNESNRNNLNSHVRSYSNNARSSGKKIFGSTINSFYQQSLGPQQSLGHSSIQNQTYENNQSQVSNTLRQMIQSIQTQQKNLEEELSNYSILN